MCRSLLAAVAAVSFVLFGCATTPEDDMAVYEFNEGIEELASNLRNSYESALEAGVGGGRRRLAVLPFVGEDGAETAVGREVANALQVALFDPALFSLLERERIDSLLAEFSFGVSGMVEDLTAAQLGNLLGAELVLVGTARQGEESATVSARIVDLAGGEILGIGQVVLFIDMIDVVSVRDSIDDGGADPGDPFDVFAEFQEAALGGDFERVIELIDTEAAAAIIEDYEGVALDEDEVIEYLWELFEDPEFTEFVVVVAEVSEVVGVGAEEADYFALDLELTDPENPDLAVFAPIDLYLVDGEWKIDLLEFLSRID